MYIRFSAKFKTDQRYSSGKIYPDATPAKVEANKELIINDMRAIFVEKCKEWMQDYKDVEFFEIYYLYGKEEYQILLWSKK